MAAFYIPLMEATLGNTRMLVDRRDFGPGADVAQRVRQAPGQSDGFNTDSRHSTDSLT